MKQRKIARIALALAVVLALTMTELTPLSMVQEASAVTQADIDKLKDELSGMNSEKAQLEKELKSIQNNKNTALAQKENIDKQINLLQSEIRNVESLISEYETLIEQTEQEIRENEEEEKRQYEKFCARVRSMEERGTLSYWSVLFNAASFSDLLSAMANQAQALGAELRPGVVHQVIAMGDSFALSLGADFIEARRVILCTGAKQPRLLPGENELLGRGVSYCGTCDGMLYRGRRVAVIAQGPEAVSEANFLAGLCREVIYFGKPEDALDPRIVVSGQKPEAILGEASVSGLRAGGEDLPFDGVFIFREAAALSALLPGLEMDGAFIRVDRRMQTNLPGVFAAGDCTGLPLQVAKAVGEGCVAAISAATA